MELFPIEPSVTEWHGCLQSTKSLTKQTANRKVLYFSIASVASFFLISHPSSFIVFNPPKLGVSFGSGLQGRRWSPGPLPAIRGARPGRLQDAVDAQAGLPGVAPGHAAVGATGLAWRDTRDTRKIVA